MAKLDKKHQKQTADAESSSFDPLPDGAYHARLRNVDASGSGEKGPYWTWEFEIVEDGEFKNRRIWNNTSLSESSAFAMKNTFEAFGAEVDADTDDLCGQVVKLVLTTRTIQQGARKGEIANQVQRLAPKDEDFEVEDAVGAGQPAADDIF